MGADRSLATAAEALAAVRSGLEFLASADATALTLAEQADCVRGLARCESVQLAAQARILSAFCAAGGPAADGQGSVRSWLRWQTQTTSAAAGAATRWMRRLQVHPDVAAALARAAVAPPVASQILDWTDRLPGEHRAAADRILAGAAAAGADLDALSALAEEITRRCAEPDADDGDDGFARRRLRLTRHYQGHAHLDADLTPAAAAALSAVLDALGRPAGPEDERTRQQRDHDALEEGCRRLVGGGLPTRAGQPTQIQLHMTLSQLLSLPEADQATAAWIAATAAPAPPGADCDTAITPIVSGTVDDDLLREAAARCYPPAGAPAASSPARSGLADSPAADAGCASHAAPRSQRLADAMAGRAAAHLTAAEAAALLSGPSGLAAWLRTSALTGPAASISLPLDLGRPTETIPPPLRRAITERDRHCVFPGCHALPQYCHVHHVIPRADGGHTSLGNCVLACSFHHLIAIHRWGWTLSLNPDGTTTATGPDGRTLHSHAPPAAA